MQKKNMHKIDENDYQDVLTKSKTNDACFIVQRDSLPYFYPIIKYLSSDIFDIVVIDSNNKDLPFSDFHLNTFKINYSKECLPCYKYIVGDIFTFKNYQPLDHQKMLGMFHGLDAQLHNSQIHYLSACIFPCQRSASVNASPINGDNIFEFAKNKKILEICYSGPFHCNSCYGHYKDIYRRQIEKELNILISNDAPLVFFLEGECSNMDDIIACVNNLSEYCQVIFKPFYMLSRHDLLSKISSNVNIYCSTASNCYALRFASDFIITNFFSGSALTSLMFDQPMLSYYSSMEKLKWPSCVKNTPIPFKNFLGIPEEILNSTINIPENFSPKQTFYSIFYREKFFFNLLDFKSIQSAITGNEYIKQYFDMLPEIKKQIFGKYYMEDADRYTAHLINTFIKNGTFGEKCNYYINR